MALQHFLWLLWTGYLFDCGVGWPYRGGYAKPDIHDFENLVDSNEDMHILSYEDVPLALDYGTDQVHPSGGTSYSELSFMPPNHATPYDPAKEEVLENMIPFDWEMKNPDALVVFPLKTQATPGELKPSSGTEEPTSVTAPVDDYFQAVPPSTQSWMPAEVETDEARQDHWEADHLVFEDVFQFPQENEISSDATAVSSYQSWYSASAPTEKPSQINTFDQTSSQTYEEIPWPVHTPVGQGLYQETIEPNLQPESLLPLGGSGPIKSPPSKPPSKLSTPNPQFTPKYIIQSRARYGRVKQYYEHTNYTPNLSPSKS
ncbi:uncharacterized protein ACB058_020409 [Synchiropus picturatus]